MTSWSHAGLTGVLAGPIASDRPPVLLTHGMMGGAWQFERFQRALSAAGHRSLAINYRGHHDSRPTDKLATLSVFDYARDALGAAATLGRPPIVVGQSMGGLIALMLAGCGAVSAAALVCSLPPGGIRWETAYRSSALRNLPAILTRRALVPHRRELDRLILNRLPAERREPFFAAQVPESSRVALEISLGLVKVDPVSVRCPLLSVSAEDDTLVLPRVGARIARRYRGEHLPLPGAGHYALVGEAGWEGVAARIVEWIGRSLGAR